MFFTEGKKVEEFIKSIILGIIQGLTEFLPVSSTGHLTLGRKFFGLSDAGLFLDTMLHLGTLIAVVVVFWDDIVYMIKNPFSKLTLLIIVGTIPTAIIGLTFKDYFDELSKTGATLGWEFLATGFILWFADTFKGKNNKSIDQISYRDALFIGTLQGVAILPAISRSGLTIAGSLFRGINKNDAARFSFLLSLPAILGAVLLQSVDIFKGEGSASLEAIGGWGPLLAGTLAAAVAGYIAVKWMMKILRTGSLKVFSIYVWALGIMVLVLQFLGKW